MMRGACDHLNYAAHSKQEYVFEDACVACVSAYSFEASEVLDALFSSPMITKQIAGISSYAAT